MSDPVRAAETVAAEVLAPAAARTDASGALPRANLDALAAAGLYALGSHGDRPFAEVPAAVEAVAAACLTTAFVWTQHLGAVAAVAGTGNDALRETYLEPLRTGAVRGGAAFTGAALPGPALLHAEPDDDDGGWRLDGTTPWITGWGHVDVLHAAGRTADDRVVWALIDARAGDGLVVEPLELLAVNASATVAARFDGYAIPAARITQITPLPPPPAISPHGTRIHAALALGVTRRCCALLGPTALDEELDAVRARLDGALDDPSGAAIVEPRAAVADLAIRAASALVAQTGARAAIAAGEPQRLAREAVFLSVFGSRPPIKAALLGRLGAV